MSFINDIVRRASSGRQTFSSRASSTSLQASHQHFDYVDGTRAFADMSIAQGLLQQKSDVLRPPQRRSSFTTTVSQPLLHIDNEEFNSQVERNRVRRSKQNISSNTWSSSAGDTPESNDKEDRGPFVEEYNRLAKKYGVPLIVPDGFFEITEKVATEGTTGSWIMRKLLRRNSSVSKRKIEKQTRHKRSISDLSLRMRSKNDSLKDKFLDELVRLCGSSALYLPDEYAPATLLVPTCFRATAQYLVQHGPKTRGIFRIPGSLTVVNSLYDHYAAQNDHGDFISGTVRCPQLPDHITCDVHDVASAFKKFLAGLPNGILGATWVFDAFLAIYSNLDSDPETTRTKQSKIKARLIALAVASMPFRYERELLCAVIGLLCMIGRAAETARREDERGRPLPTADLMGYGPLGVVFGPLLLGELIHKYEVNSLSRSGQDKSSQTSGRSPPKSMRDKHKKKKSSDDNISLQLQGEKIRLANSIAEMLITNWREVIRHMKDIGALKSVNEHPFTKGANAHVLRPSASESFALRKPPDWGQEGVALSIRRINRSRSPTPSSRNDQQHSQALAQSPSEYQHLDSISVRKQRANPRRMSSQMLSGAKSMSVLAPTAEETPADIHDECLSSKLRNINLRDDTPIRHPKTIRPTRSSQTFYSVGSKPVVKFTHPDSHSSVYSCSQFPQENSETQGNLTNGSNIHHTSQEKEAQSTRAAMPQILSPTDQLEKYISVVPSQCRMPSMHWNTVVKPGLQVCQFGGAATVDQAKSGTEQQNDPGTSKARSRAPPEVPDGIVSRRLRGIAASDPGVQPPSGFLAFLPLPDATNSRDMINRHKRRYPARSTSSHTRTLAGQSKDALGQVSQEEDLASLASLAEVIGSEDGPSDIKRVTILAANKNPDRNASLKQRTSLEGPSEVDVTEIFHRSDKTGMQNDGVRPNSSALPSVPVTPRKQIIESAMTANSIRSNVKTLAAQFNKVDQTSLRTLSPTKSPLAKCRNRDSQNESGVISAYTVNPSPGWSHKSSKSDRSRHSSQYKLPTARYIETSPTRSTNTKANESLTYPKSLSPTKLGKGTSSTPPQWRRLFNIQGELGQSTLDPTINSRNSVSVLGLQRTGDGASCFSTSRQSSLGTLLPRPDEPPVAQHMNFPRPSSTPATGRSGISSSPIQIGSIDSFIPDRPAFSDTQDMTLFNVGTRARGNSLLYSQVQNLARQLEAKKDEADQLRHQLVAIGRLSELGTLAEELRRTQRELKIWRDRAELAERRLEMLAGLHPIDMVEKTVCLPMESLGSMTIGETESGMGNSKDNARVSESIKKESTRMANGICLNESPESTGTIRYGSAEDFSDYCTELENDDENKENIPPEENFNSLCELE